MLQKKLTASIMILFNLFVLNVSAQYSFDWASTEGGTSYDRGQSVAADGLGNVYSTGSFLGTVDFDPGVGVFNLISNGDEDIFVQKIDATGNLVWAKQIGGIDQDRAWSIAVDASGNAHVIGMFKLTVDFDPGVGITNLSSAGQNDVYILKLDTAGDLDWVKQISSTSDLSGYDIAVDASSNVYTTGGFYPTVDFDPGIGVMNLTSSGSNDVFVQKLDASGNLIWAKRMGGSSSDIGHSIDVDLSGNVYSSGGFLSNANFGATNLTSNGSVDGFVQKLDVSGNVLWAKQTGGTGIDVPNCIAVDAIGNVIIAGEYQSTLDFDPGIGVLNATSNGGRDFYLQKLDPFGNLIWVNQFGDISSDSGFSVATDAASNVIVSGFFNGVVDFDSGIGVENLTESSWGSGDIFVAKYDSFGQFMWVAGYGGNGSDNSSELALDGDENILVTGVFESTVDFDHTVGVANFASNGNTDVYVLKLKKCLPVAGTDIQSACNTYDWIDGNTYTASNNTATWTLTTPAGCDSIVTLDLTVNYSNAGTDVQTACNSFDWIDGNTYTATNNTAIWTLTNAAGCDSVVTLDLTVNYSNIGTDVQTACDAYTWIDGNTYTATNNTATWTETNAAGCDSVITLDLTVNYSNTGTDVQTACNSLDWIDGNTYTATNNSATWTLTNTAGCDSVVTLDLTVNYSNIGTDVQTACDAYTWIDGNTYTTTNNTATWTETNAAGCDSIVTLDLTVNYSNTGTDAQIACDSYTWIDGNTYTTTNNTATWTETNAAGCDSIVTLDLTVNYSNTGTDVHTVCDSIIWIDGNTYSSTNNSATWILTNAAGCDSIITLDLTVNSNTGIDVQTACESYTWIDGNTYTSSNNSVTWTLTNAVGCDSVVTLDLTINQLVVSVNQFGSLLTADQVGANYQWLDCDDNNSIIEGETNQSYTPTAIIGNYAVEIDLNGCIDTSACYLVDYTGLSDLYKDKMSLSPNPADDQIAILGLDEVCGLQSIEVISSGGKLEFKVDDHSSQLNVYELAPGVYFIRVVHENGIETLRFIKK